MKKAKNDTAKTNTKPAENQKKNAPQKEKAQGELPFKKALYGYDPDEVAAYIDEISTTYASSMRIHESKLSSLKEELLLSNRERDSYSEKYKECKALLDKALDGRQQTPQPHDNSAQYEETIEALRKKLELAERENENLRKAAESKNETKALEYTDRIAALEKEKAQLAQTDTAGGGGGVVVVYMLLVADEFLVGAFEAGLAKSEHITHLPFSLTAHIRSKARG